MATAAMVALLAAGALFWAIVRLRRKRGGQNTAARTESLEE